MRPLATFKITTIHRANRHTARPLAPCWYYKTRFSRSRYYKTKEDAIIAAKQNGYEVF